MTTTYHSPISTGAPANSVVWNAPLSELDAAVFAVSKGLILGLRLTWVSATALDIETGAAYLEGSQQVLALTSKLSKTGLSLAANTWYHVYFYLRGAAADVELATTAPAAPYFGAARSKTGDTSRRYLGSVRTDGSGNLLSFFHNTRTNFVTWAEALTSVLTNGKATAYTAVDCSTCAPVTSREIYITGVNIDAVQAVSLKSSDYSAAQITFFATVRMTLQILINSSQQFQYIYAAAPTNGFYVSVIGYGFER